MKIKDLRILSQEWWGAPAGCPLQRFGPERDSKRSFAEVLDSEIERCRMRLPLTGRWFEGRRKRLSRKENFR
ncbi:hypothetical protein, partial [Pseudomonas aeruginosa]|uniref:hypothetical protein n=1 Tax=Pseudomonas aeruginosa TaxID=287 RepID=UPI001C12D3C8